MSYPVIVEFPSTDRLVDLKLAFLESQLEDLYDGVIFNVDHRSDGKPIRVKIEFLTQDDQIHWILSVPHISHVQCEHWLMWFYLD